MDIYIYNKSLENIGIVDTSSSFIWHRRFFKAGEFQINVGATKNALTLLKKGYFVSFEDTEEFGVIDTLNITQSEGQTEIIAKGSIGKGLLRRRQIDSQTVLQCEAELAIRQLVNENCINPSNTNRAINIIELGTLQNYTETVDCVANSNDNLLDFLVAISQSTNIGFELFFDKENQKLKLECFEGTDRSIEQTVNPQVIFSQEYDNLRSCDYLCSDVGCVNCVKAQYSPNIYATTGNGNTGLDRYEGYIEETTGVTKLAMDDDGNVYDILDIPGTLEALADKAKQAVIPETENFEGEVDFTQGYKTDYDLGDIVTLSNFGVEFSPRIYEVQEVYSGDRKQAYPVFGSPAVTLTDILKKG